MPEQTELDEQAAADVAENAPAVDAEQAIDDATAAADEVSAEVGGDGGGDVAVAGDDLDPADIDALLQSATIGDADSSDAAGKADAASAGKKVDLPDFRKVLSDVESSSIDLLRDVELDVTIELGQSRMLIQDVLKLVEGSVVELDKLAGDPVDVFINKRLVARGEVLVLNDNFCVRVNEIVQVAAPEVA